MAKNNNSLSPEIEKLSERLAKDPKSLVFSPLANAYRKNNMIDEAIEILQKGLALHPNYASARTVLGRCYVDKRMYEMAKVEFNKAIESDPQNIVVLESLGKVYKTLSQYEEACRIYKKLLEIDPLNDNFERELKSLENLSGNIPPDSSSFDTFQTIPPQKKEGKEEISEQEKVIEKTTTPTLSQIFEESPEEKPPQQKEKKEEKEKKDNVAPTSFEEMFDKPTPAPEVPETGIAEESSSPPIEQPKVEEEEKQSEGLKEPEMIQKTEHEKGNDIKVEGITSLFEETNTAAPEKFPEEKPVAAETTPPSSKTLEEVKSTTEIESPKETIEVEKPPAEDTGQENITETKEPTEKREKPIATETLAEIYLNQGFLEEALNIYKELLTQKPDDENIKKKIEILERKKSSEPKKEEQPPQNSPSTTEVQEKPTEIQKEPTEDEKRGQSKNLDNFQDWLNKFQK